MSSEPAPPARPAPPRRSWLSIRWRQFRNPPRPVFRAVAADTTVAVVLGVAYLAYDMALSRGAQLPGGDLRTAAVAAYVAIVLVVGSVATYLIVPQPARAGGRPGRSGWSAMLGFLAAVPIAYLVLVVLDQVVKPMLG